MKKIGSADTAEEATARHDAVHSDVARQVGVTPWTSRHETLSAQASRRRRADSESTGRPAGSGELFDTGAVRSSAWCRAMNRAVCG